MAAFLTYREPGTPALPINGVDIPEDITDTDLHPGGENKGVTAPEAIGGCGGVQFGSGKNCLPGAWPPGL